MDCDRKKSGATTKGGSPFYNCFENCRKNGKKKKTWPGPEAVRNAV
jgi:hypothetical protein